MEYKINLGIYGDIFAVPSAVVDNCIKLARGNDIKVILYLLRHSGKSLSAADIASACKISEEQVSEAVEFWTRAGILGTDGDAAKFAPPADESSEATTHEAPTVGRKTSKITLTPKEIADRIEGSSEIKFMFESAERILGRILNSSEHRSLIYMYDYLGLSADIILMLLDYCKSIDKTSLKYVEAIAVGWHDRDISTHESAEREIRIMNERRTLASKVKSIFGIETALSTKQKEFISEWADKELPLELISYAYEKCMDAKGKMNFSYINGILCKWAAKGYSTREQADSEAKSSANSGLHSYDLDEFERAAAGYIPKSKEGE